MEYRGNLVSCCANQIPSILTDSPYSIDSLRKLHRKAENVDALFYPRAESTTTRTAWDKVRDNLGSDADAQQAFMDMLANDVIKPLEMLNESNVKTRERIEKNLKSSAAGYADHAENRVSKLQQAYLRKYQPQQHAYSANASQRPQDAPNKRFGSRVSTLFRGRREASPVPEPAKAAPYEEVSEDACREAVLALNKLRWLRVEDLGDGYDCLDDLVFTPTVKEVLVKYMDGAINACAKRGDVAKNTRTEVENALGGTDTYNLRASFRAARSLSIPPLTLYHHYRPGEYSNLIFGVPLVDHETNEDNVPKVMRMCIDEVEKRGLNIPTIYSSGIINETTIKEWRHRFESEESFSFTSADHIHFITAFLKSYLKDLPEPLFALSRKEYRHYTLERPKYTKDNFSLLRSKIRELQPVHRASLGALLRHLSHVASHSDNKLTVKALSISLCYDVLWDFCDRDVIHVPVLEDLIQNAPTLFDKLPSQSPPVPSSNIAEVTSTDTYGSLFLSPESPESAEVEATGSSSRHRPGIVDGTPASAQSSFSSFPSDASPDSRSAPPQTALLSPLLGLSSSKTLMEGVETTAQEQLVPEARDTEVVKTPPDVVPLPGPTSVAEWRLHQSQLSPDPEAQSIPQTPPGSVLSSTSDFPLSSATSLQTRLWSP
ncbi:hypothetical protein V8E53_002220 [Lactarius tabidus]